MAEQEKKLSKTLSYILRHGAVNMGLKVQSGGFIYVDELLCVPQLRRYTYSDVEKVVDNNNKQRFFLENDRETGRVQIRANQGHSLEVSGLNLRPITDAKMFPSVVHGTYRACWENIQRTGLSRMARNHIHFAAGEPGDRDVISGMRASCDILIYIELKKALQDGYEFYLSTNNVILCPGDGDGVLPPRYFSAVVDRRTSQQLTV